MRIHMLTRRLRGLEDEVSVVDRPGIDKVAGAARRDQ